MERKLDKLSRLVIPKEFLRAWGIRGEDKPLMCIDDHHTHLRIYPQIAKCAFCDLLLPPPYTLESMYVYKGKPVCPQCLGEIADGAEKVREGGKVVLSAWVTTKQDRGLRILPLNETAL